MRAALLLLVPLLLQDSSEKERIRALFERLEKDCLNKGWKREKLKVGGLERKLLWKGPANWTKGAIIALHGGGGTHSNFGSGVRVGKPMVDFGTMAIEKGFAVFALDSTDGKVTDAKGRPCGKRWDCTLVKGRKNIDLPFIERVIEKVIPDLRPEGANESIFITGISNGGYMTILAATHLADRVTAFAPVSCGDPYGTYMDMGTRPRSERANAPGVFRDRETNKLISERDCAKADDYPNESKWPRVDGKKPPFKQFQDKEDGVVDYSCHLKARKLLVKHGFRDAGAFVLDENRGRSLLNHFWRGRYNRPLIEFFAKQVE